MAAFPRVDNISGNEVSAERAGHMILTAGPAHRIADIDGRFIRQIDKNAKRQTLYAFNLDLTDNLIPRDNDLVVQAYSVAVSGELKSEGRSVQIICRNFHCAPNSVLDVRGPSAFPDYRGQAARNGLNPGQAGENGADGGEGSHAGNVTIVCDEMFGSLTIRASGGAGGGAQSGGSGSAGSPGGDNSEPGTQGGGGQDGGAPGRAGTPGRGGNAGIVTVRTVKALSAGQIRSSTQEGPAGTPGEHGRPGPGGPGGMGASGRVCWYED